MLFFITHSYYGQIITTVVGNGIGGYSGDGGLATLAQIKNPNAIVFDTSGNFYVADNANNRIRKINALDTITTFAGNGTAGYNGDNGLAISAEINVPTAISYDKFDNLYIADALNHVIRKVNTSGIITTFAGTGTQGYSGDNGPAASANLSIPIGLVFDTLGNLFVSEQGNGTIRKINTSGTIITIAGTGTNGYNGDNIPAISAQLYAPGHITFDGQGNLYISDQTNNRIRRIDSSGIITTVAGTGISGYTGDNAAATSAQLYSPFGIICDKSGNIYFSDAWNHVIRKINAAGIITTIAGTGASGYNGDGIVATTAQLYYPEGIALDTAGNLYISDSFNHRIRKVTNVAIGMNEEVLPDKALQIYPNPGNGDLTINYLGKGKTLVVEVKNVFGQFILSKKFEIISDNEYTLGGLTEGVYIVKLTVDDIPCKASRIIVTK